MVSCRLASGSLQCVSQPCWLTSTCRPDLRGQAGPGEEGGWMLVQADGQHPWVGPERRLHAVTVMHVDVDIGHPLGTLAKQPFDGDRRVVVHAEPAGVAGHGMMQTA